MSLAAGVALPSAQATNTDGGGAGSVFVPVTPCRLFDTRSASAVGTRNTPLTAGETYTQKVAGDNGNCSIPLSATAVAMNVTIVNPTAPSFLTLFPADAAQPTASNLNWVGNQAATPNKVDVKLSATGEIKLFNNGGTVDVVGDIVGYYADHNHDDRYYTKAQVDALVSPLQTILLPRSAIQPIGSVINYSSTTHNCSGNATPFTLTRLPIEIPIGAELVSVKINIFDGGGAAINQPFALTLERDDLTIVGNQPVTLAMATGGNLNANTATRTLVPPTTEIATADTTYEVEMSGLYTSTTDGNGFCGAVVTYRPAVPVAP